MKTQELFDVLRDNQDKSLIFEYEPQEFVGANYHITEVKHVTVDAIDCGANADFWRETVIQLWESPKEIGKREFMSTTKALSILNRVGTMKPYDLDAEVKFEYSNDTFNTAQLFVNDFETDGQSLILKLAIEKTDCKAKSECALPSREEMTAAEPCCGPGGNCC